MDEHRIMALEREFNEYQNVLYSIADIICILIRKIAEEHGLLDQELEEKIAKIESRL